MKKLLACLLALMLPLTALADCLSLEMYWSLWPDGMTALIGSLTDGQRYPLMEEWLGELAAFLSGFSVTCAADDASGYGYLTFRYGEEALYSFDVTATDQGTVMRHSAFPDMPLLLSPDNLYADPSALLPRSLSDVPWDDVLVTFRACLNRWAQAMETTEAKGHFAGDAYAGGAHRTTLRFDERDLALLTDMLLDAQWPEAFTALFAQPIRAAGGQTDDARAYLRNQIRKVALDNRYRYVLHLVDDARGEPIGLSLIAYLADQQVATLSVGAAPDGGITLVLGWGVRDENVYLSARITPEGAEGHRFSAELLRDAARQQNVQAAAQPLMRLDLYDLALEEADIWKLTAAGEALGDMAVEVTFYHALSEAGSANSALLKLNDQQLALVNLDFRSMDALTAPELSGLALIDVSDLTEEDVIGLAEAASATIAELGVRLFQLMPPKLLTLPLNPRFLSPE